MKVLFIALCLVAGAFARSAVQQNEVKAEGPSCPIDDPLIRPGPIAINVTLDPLVSLLEGSQITNLIGEGLSTLRYRIDLNVLLLTATFEVTIPRVSGNATYTAQGYLDPRPISAETIPQGNITGSGFGKLAATGVQAKGSATLFINLIGNKVTLSRLSLDVVNFDSLELDLGQEITIGGQKVDWANLSANIKANFDREFAQHKDAVTDKVRLAANNIIGKYTLAELIDLIGGGGDDGEC